MYNTLILRVIREVRKAKQIRLKKSKALENNYFLH